MLNLFRIYNILRLYIYICIATRNKVPLVERCGKAGRKRANFDSRIGYCASRSNDKK